MRPLVNPRGNIHAILNFFCGTDYLRVTFTLTVRQCNFGGS